MTHLTLDYIAGQIPDCTRSADCVSNAHHEWIGREHAQSGFRYCSDAVLTFEQAGEWIEVWMSTGRAPNETNIRLAVIQTRGEFHRWCDVLKIERKATNGL